jgi:Bacterial Ig domain/Right handed beta helix region
LETIVPKRFYLITLLLLVFLAACNQEAITNPKDNPSATLQAVADTYTFNQSALSLVDKDKGVLSNDTLPQTFELAVSTSPQHGTLELHADGSFSYQHNGNSEKGDSFTYKVRSAGLEAETKVTIILESTSSPEPSPEVSPCFTSVQSGQPFECQFTGATSYALENAPVGMVMQQRSGFLRWTPTAHQVGSYTFTVTSNTGDSHILTLTVTPGNADPTGLYVSPDGSDTNPGSPEAPFKTIQYAVDQATPGTTIYLRGGEYFNPDYGKPFDSSRKSNGIARITVSGTAQNPITIRPQGNEWVHLISDENGLMLHKVNYWIVDGLEVSGLAQSLTLEDAMQIWWDDNNERIDGRGIITNSSQHIVIRNNVIHDFPGAGINDSASDFITIENNVVYNNAWWSTSGVQGVANSGLLATDPSTANLEKIIMRGNLVFGNQSLLISHVFSKGYVTLTIDEGNGLHLQNTQKSYLGKALVENNLMLFNGKAGLGLNTIDGVTVRNNSFYQNARVGELTGELILRLSTATRIENNLFVPRPNQRSIQDTKNAFANVLANAAQASNLDGDLPASVLRLEQVFQNPEQFDFRAADGVLAGMGVPDADLERMFAVAKMYGISVTAPDQVIDDAYLAQMKQRIFDTWPAAYSDLILEDKETGFDYTYAQRCQYPEAPSAAPCP